MPVPAKLVIIGLDAGDKDLILDWTRKGKLPHFRRLLERATWGLTENPLGMEAGSVWPSFYTGVSAAKHGMYYAFETPGENSYATRAFEERDFTAEPFWNALSRAGKRVAVVDAPYSFLSHDINGVQVLDWLAHAPMAGINHFHEAFRTSPPALAREIERRFGRDSVGYCDLLHLTSADDYRKFRDAMIDRVRRKTELNLFLLAQGQWDCFFSVYHECHCIGHQAWHFHDRAHPRHDAEMQVELGDIVEQVYAAIDEGLGKTLDFVGPRTNVIVLCSHGMAADYSGSLMLDDILLRLEGIRGDGGKNVVRAVHNTWLKLPRPVKEAVKPLRSWWPHLRRSVLEPDRRKRKCFEIRNNDASGGIRLNLKGRESAGRLAPGAEADAFCEQLAHDLLALVVPETGKPAVARVIRTAQVHLGPRACDLPDLLIDWNREAPIYGVHSPKTGYIPNRDLPARTGDHRPVGLFLASGPGFRPSRLNETTSVYSFAPTIAEHFALERTDSDAEASQAILRGLSRELVPA